MSDEPLLPCVEIEPSAEADASVIWLHGLGADGHDFEPIVPHLGLGRSHGIRFVFPHAPSIPVTLNLGMVMPAWYDISRLDAMRHDEAGLRLSAGRVKRLIEREVQRGIDTRRIVLAGFSQGGAVALHLGTRLEQPLAGILALSTYMLVREKLAAEASEANAHTPILMAHGTFDPMVPVGWGEAARDQLEASGYDVTWRTWPMQHEVCLEEIEVIGAWLRERLPGA
ncbi:MAG: alpha/beta hydrolase [Planctomycetota bacterium]